MKKRISFGYFSITNSISYIIQKLGDTLILRDFILPIQESIKTTTGAKRGMPKIVVELFNHAGCSDLSEEENSSAIKRWVAKENAGYFQRCPGAKYFDGQRNIFNADQLFGFIRTYPCKDWADLQKCYEDVSNKLKIDTETHDEIVFYWSMVQEFQLILGLNVSDPPAEIMEDSKPISENGGKDIEDKGQAKTEKNDTLGIVEEFSRMTRGFRIEEFINTPTNKLKVSLVEDACFVCGHLDRVTKNAKELLESEETYNTIHDFIDTLHDYITFLNDNDRNKKSFPDNMNYPTDGEFISTAQKKQVCLLKLFEVSKSKVEDELKQRYNKIKAEQKHDPSPGEKLYPNDSKES